MITLTDESNCIHKIKIIEFSDGAVNVEIPTTAEGKVGLNWLVEDVTKEQIVLELVLSAIEEAGLEKPDTLFLPYLPNARADRVFKVGNANPLKVFMKYLQRLNFNEIICYDLHSKQSLDLAKELGVPLKEQSQASVVLDQFKKKIKGSVIVAPDKGSLLKASEIADKLNTSILVVDKKRCVDTGKILSVDVPVGDYTGKFFTICDDICDGGGTFLPIASKLKELGASEVNLCITHGIFSKGLSLFEKDIDKLFVANIVSGYVTTHDIQKFNLREEE